MIDRLATLENKLPALQFRNNPVDSYKSKEALCHNIVYSLHSNFPQKLGNNQKEQFENMPIKLREV